MAKRTLLTEIYNSVPVITYEGDDEPIHTDERPYCDDQTCPCWDDYEEAWIPFRNRDQDRNQTTQCADGSWW